jgi:signal transduction histidine kinase
LSLGPFIYAAIVHKSYWLKGHHASGLVHELKSPLASIESAADMMTDLVKQSPHAASLTDYLHMIENNTQRLKKFVDNLLVVARDNEDVQLQKSAFNLTSLAQSWIELCDPSAKKKGIELFLEAPPELMVIADQEKIDLVFSTLMSNALKFSQAGNIKVGLRNTPDGVQVSINDQGKGIPPKELKRVFEKYYQVDRGQKGAGIGLAIARMWVEAHGGRIWAESEGEGKGSCFWFTLQR